MLRKIITYIGLNIFLLSATLVFADTVSLKNGEEIKGIVVEEYKDRVVVSTYEGEKGILKADIREILYDMPEQNLVKLGDTCLARREYEKAYFYYEKAHHTNPSHRIARDKMNYVMGYLFRRREQDKLEDVKRRRDFDSWPPAPPEPEETLEKKLEDIIGIRLNEEKNRVKITKVRKGSPAFTVGLEKNDVLVSVWGRLTGYMSVESVARLLLEESFGEIKMGIEREIALKNEPPFTLDMLVNGLTLVAVKRGGKGQKAGLVKGDLITAINGTSTRYMPLKDAIKMIENPKRDTVVLSIRREVTIWRK